MGVSTHTPKPDLKKVREYSRGNGRTGTFKMTRCLVCGENLNEYVNGWRHDGR